MLNVLGIFFLHFLYLIIYSIGFILCLLYFWAIGDDIRHFIVGNGNNDIVITRSNSGK